MGNTNTCTVELHTHHSSLRMFSILLHYHAVSHMSSTWQKEKIEVLQSCLCVMLLYPSIYYGEETRGAIHRCKYLFPILIRNLFSTMSEVTMMPSLLRWDIHVKSQIHYLFILMTIYILHIVSLQFKCLILLSWIVFFIIQEQWWILTNYTVCYKITTDLDISRPATPILCKVKWLFL